MKGFLPQPEILIVLQPEEVGLYLLPYLNSLDSSRNTFSMYNLLLDTNSDIKNYMGDYSDYEKIKDVLTESIQWLINEGYLAIAPTNSAGWFLITRRGREVKQKVDFEKNSYIKLLPYQQMDERLRDKIVPPYIRGEFANAVFNAYKEVEIRLRDITGLDNGWYGIKLVRKTFNPEDGLLIDKEETEQESKRFFELISGAVGTFKNPPSHRDVDYKKPIEVIGLILFANYLIQVIMQRGEEYRNNKSKL